MKIKFFKNENEYITRDCDLTNCSVEELEKNLFKHCEELRVDPINAAVIIPAESSGGYERIIKGRLTKMTTREVAVELLKMQGRDFSGQCENQRGKKPNFANGFNYFCCECGVFFSVELEPDAIGSAEYCPYCGENNLAVSCNDLLSHCLDNDTDPVNFYKAFPPDEPIPDSRTGATPRQVSIIIDLVSARNQEKLPVTAENIAGPSDSHIEIVRKVFEELHITETGGAA